MLALLSLALVLATLASPRPPQATIEDRPLGIASYCWRTRCASPLDSARAGTVVRPGATVHVPLGFVPRSVTVLVDGVLVRSTRSGVNVTWIARRVGGVTLSATAPAGWVTYVGRLRG